MAQHRFTVIGLGLFGTEIAKEELEKIKEQLFNVL